MERDDERGQELIDDLLAERAPSLSGDLTQDEAELAQTVALLKCARPGAMRPDPAFVASLRERLFSASAAADSPAPGEGPASERREHPSLTRRRLLGALAGSAAAGMALGGLAGHAAAEGDAAQRVRLAEKDAAASARRASQVAADAATRQTRPFSVPLVGAHGIWQTVADEADLAPGDAKRFEAGALVGYLLRDAAGGYRAVSAACTHMGCLLTWQGAGRRLLCPCHGSAYDERGRVVSGVARHPLPPIAVRVQANGAVQVWTVAGKAGDSGVPPYTAP